MTNRAEDRERVQDSITPLLANVREEAIPA